MRCWSRIVDTLSEDSVRTVRTTVSLALLILGVLAFVACTDVPDAILESADEVAPSGHEGGKAVERGAGVAEDEEAYQEDPKPEQLRGPFRFDHAVSGEMIVAKAGFSRTGSGKRRYNLVNMRIAGVTVNPEMEDAAKKFLDSELEGKLLYFRLIEGLGDDRQYLVAEIWVEDKSLRSLMKSRGFLVADGD